MSLRTMPCVKTYVFLDLETTGIPSEEMGKTRITEISLIAVKRDHVLDTMPGKMPRVQHKITLCLNPTRIIQPGSTEITGLSNFLLENEPVFKENVFIVINTFLNMLSTPVCLIAQNGHGFDFPILKHHLCKLGLQFADGILCADCYHGFYDILEEKKRIEQLPLEEDVSPERNGTVIESTDIKDENDFFSDNTLKMKAVNESTPIKRKLNKEVPMGNIVKSKRRFPWSKGNKPAEKYKLKDIHERLLNRPGAEAHRAENDCILAIECAVVLSKDFVAWVDNNCVPFSEILPMTPGVPLGLLLATGVLWGCTNPFIRKGTKGLRLVKAESKAGQVYAELLFLLSNWRYVLPWLINQTGSLLYLMAVQRLPLSIAVPGANSLAFAFTAVTAAAIGSEEPLDFVAVLGVLLIVGGTYLCCVDRV